MIYPAEQLESVIALAESDLAGGEFDARFCAELARLFNAELASILEYDPEARALRFRHSMDLSETERAGIFIRLGEGVCGVAAYTGRTMAVEEATKVSEAAARIARETGREVTTLLAAPAMRRGRCVAVIEILNRREGTFTEEDRSTLRLLAALYAQRGAEEALPAAKPRRPAPVAPIELPEETAILGASPAIEAALRVARSCAGADVPVLILGESGTGKELFARRIHESSARRDRPFVAINCPALSETLLESELFGHARGAFTGAHQSRRGRLEDANTGTVFLDEIGDMSAACQAKLLRTLDRGEISPVGSNETRRIDVRFIAATNRPIESMIERGEFRADLYYRLRGVDLRLPPLRERRGDIPLLADVFLRRAAQKNGRNVTGLEPEALRALQEHAWPGNVRELSNAVGRAVLMAEGERVTLDDVREVVGAQRGGAISQDAAPAPPTGAPHDEFEGRLMEILKETAYAGTGRWNISEAARRLGVPRKTLEYKIRKLGGGPS